MKIYIEEEFITLNLDKRTDTILMSADDTQKCIETLKQFSSYIEFIEPKIRSISEIWSAQVGIFDQGIALKFNKFTTKVKLPHKIVIVLIKQLENALISYKRGFQFKIKKAPV